MAFDPKAAQPFLNRQAARRRTSAPAALTTAPPAGRSGFLITIEESDSSNASYVPVSSPAALPRMQHKRSVSSQNHTFIPLSSPPSSSSRLLPPKPAPAWPELSTKLGIWF